MFLHKLRSKDVRKKPKPNLTHKPTKGRRAHSKLFSEKWALRASRTKTDGAEPFVFTLEMRKPTRELGREREGGFPRTPGLDGNKDGHGRGGEGRRRASEHSDRMGSEGLEASGGCPGRIPPGPRPLKRQEEPDGPQGEVRPAARRAPEPARPPCPDPLPPGVSGAPGPHPQLLGDVLPLQVAVRGREGLQAPHLLAAPLLLVDARVFPVLPELADLLCAAAALKLRRQTQAACGAVPLTAGQDSQAPGTSAAPDQAAGTCTARSGVWAPSAEPEPSRPPTWEEAAPPAGKPVAAAPRCWLRA